MTPDPTIQGAELFLDLLHYRSQTRAARAAEPWIRFQVLAKEIADWIKTKGTGSVLVCGGPGVGKTVVLARLAVLLSATGELDATRLDYLVDVELLSCHDVCQALVHVLRSFCDALLGPGGDGSSTFVRSAGAADGIDEIGQIEKLIEDVQLTRLIRNLQDAHNRTLHTVIQPFPGDERASSRRARERPLVSIHSRPYDTVTAEHELWNLLMKLRDWARESGHTIRVYFVINGLQRFTAPQAIEFLEALRRVIRLPETFFVISAGLALHTEWRRRERLEEGHPLRSLVERVEYLPAFDLDDLVGIYVKELRSPNAGEILREETRAILCLAFRSGVQLQGFRQQLYEHSKAIEGTDSRKRRLQLGHWRFGQNPLGPYALLRIICLLFIHLPDKLEPWDRDVRRRFIYLLVSELDSRSYRFSARDLFGTEAVAELAAAGRQADATTLIVDFLRILDLCRRVVEEQRQIEQDSGRHPTLKDFLEALHREATFLDRDFSLWKEGSDPHEPKFRLSPFSLTAEQGPGGDERPPVDFLDVQSSNFSARGWVYGFNHSERLQEPPRGRFDVRRPRT